MSALLIVLIVLAVFFFGLGIFVTAVKWLLWVALALLLIAGITALWRYITGKRKNTSV